MTTNVQESVAYRDTWGNVLAHLRTLIKKSEFLTWFRETALLDNKNGVLVVGVPSEFYLTNVARHKDSILKAAKEIATAQFPVEDVEFVLDGSIHKQDKRVVPIDKLNRDLERKQTSNVVTLVEGVSSKILNPRYSLDNFIVGPSNQLAYAACQAVSQKPGEAYNPLFIYGDVGLGKTHLLQSIGNAIHKRDRKKSIVYSTSEKFLNEVIEAVQKRQTQKLRKKYREIDVLIIDDIQFLAHKEQTQIEFFHTFNVLHEARKQIILSSDRPPKELLQLEPRLRSRFEQGMIVDVQVPDFETRLAILRAKCQDRGLLLSGDLLEFIAHNANSSVRELEGILNQAVAQYELVKQTPTIRSIAPLLQKLNGSKHLTGLPTASAVAQVQTEEEVVACVADYFKIAEEDLCGTSRKKEIAVPRQIAMYFCKTELGRTYERIGEVFSGRLHSTVMHAVSKIQKELETDARLVRDTNALKERMGFL